MPEGNQLLTVQLIFSSAIQWSAFINKLCSKYVLFLYVCVTLLMLLMVGLDLNSGINNLITSLIESHSLTYWQW